jgi:PIN domain nuclease of toxin-antitoxin system
VRLLLDTLVIGLRTDPFDRMLVAQAQTEGVTFVTHDRQLQPYDVPIVWV